jgi:hypothetical protein
MKEHAATTYSLAREVKSKLIKFLGLAANFQEIQEQRSMLNCIRSMQPAKWPPFFHCQIIMNRKILKR